MAAHLFLQHVGTGPGRQCDTNWDPQVLWEATIKDVCYNDGCLACAAGTNHQQWLTMLQRKIQEVCVPAPVAKTHPWHQLKTPQAHQEQCKKCKQTSPCITGRQLVTYSASQMVGLTLRCPWWEQ